VTTGTDAAPKDLRGYVIDAFGDDGAVLVVDETGDLRKGVHCVGVQRPEYATSLTWESVRLSNMRSTL
jgi:hypothetical protein